MTLEKSMLSSSTRLTLKVSRSGRSLIVTFDKATAGNLVFS